MASAAQSLLVAVPWSEKDETRFVANIRKRFPDISISTATTLDGAAAAVPKADILLTFGGFLRRDIFAAAARLRWVQALGSGVDGIIDAPSLSRNVIVTATRGIHGPSLSEAALLYMLGLSRGLHRSFRAQERKEWAPEHVSLLHRKTVVILGVGSVAQDLALRCKALDMRVVGVSRTSRSTPGFDQFRSRDELIPAAMEADFLVVLVPLSADTHHIVNAEVLSAMKPTGFLINIARGGVIDEQALVAALSEGRIGGAGLDVFEQEPLPKEHPLWSTPNTIVTPHTGSYFKDYIEFALEQFATNFEHFCAGRYEQMSHREDALLSSKS